VTVLTEIAEQARAAARAADAETLEAAGLQVLDTVACVVSGASHPLAGRWLGILPRAEGSGVTSIAAPGTFPLETAVEIEATFAHVDEFDALHTAAAVAPGAVVVPVALLLGAQRGATGETVARAIIAGYEALIEAALRFGGANLYRSGWWPTALFGAIGSASAGAHLLGLDQEETTNALALAATSLGGLLSADELADGHYLLCGRAAALGTRSAIAAEAGLTASASLLDAPAAAAIGEPSAASDGRHAHLLDTGLKRWPCARPLHAALAALEALVADGETLENAEVVEVGLPEPLLRFVTDTRDPASPVEAAASAAVAVAGASVGRADDPGWYREVGLGQTALPAIDVRACAVPALGELFPERWGAEVTVRSVRGTATRRELVPPGDPERPLPTEIVRAKAARLLGLTDDAPVLQRMLRLAEQSDVSGLRSELRAAADA
jgi:2-methylcitrate dehydratase PrpD